MPANTRIRHKGTETQRFWAKVDTGATFDDCWEWQAYIYPNGYGQFTLDDGKKKYVHRLAYELVVGPIPEGLEIDHLCRNRACARPTHLEAVPHIVNLHRGLGAPKTHCINGHLFDLLNTYYEKVGRRCRTCGMLNKRAQRLRQRTAHG